LIPIPTDGTTWRIVRLPGMRENLLRLTARLNPPFGKISPVSSVNRPGLPSRAGIGFHRGDCSSLSGRLDAEPFLSGFGAGVAPPFAGLLAVAATAGCAAASLEASGAEFAVETVVTVVEDSPASLTRSGLSPSAKEVEIKKRDVKTRIPARPKNFIPTSSLLRGQIIATLFHVFPLPTNETPPASAASRKNRDL